MCTDKYTYVFMYVHVFTRGRPEGAVLYVGECVLHIYVCIFIYIYTYMCLNAYVLFECIHAGAAALCI